MIGPPIDGRPVPRGSCGVVSPEGEVKLVIAEGQESPSYGELWVRSPGVTPGYYRLPEVNSERFEDGWLKTGDVFARDAEAFSISRASWTRCPIPAAENVYPLEVGNMLLRHPAVAEASVVAVPMPSRGKCR